MAAEKYEFDVAYTSVLKRAIRTLWIALDEMDMMWIPVHKSWRLNERHYGAPAGAEQGRNGREAWRGAGQDLAPQLRHSAAAAARGRSGAPVARPPIYDIDPGAIRSRQRVAEGHGRALPSVLGVDDRARDQGGKARPHRRARQQPPRAGEISGQHVGRGDRRAEHPDRRPARLSAQRRPEAAAARSISGIPRRSARKPRRSRTRAKVAARNRKGGREAALSTASYLTSQLRTSCYRPSPSLRPRRSAASAGTAIVRGQLERLPSREQAGRRRDLGHCRAIVPVDEADDGFERDAHVEPGFAGPRTARFDLRILSNSSGNRVGQLFREPVHDVIHSCSSYHPPPGRDPGRLPIRTCSGRGGVAGIGRQSVHL